MASVHWHRIPLAVRWIVGILILLLVLILALGLIDWNAARGPLDRMASRRLERTVMIRGPLHVHLFSLTPGVDIGNLTVANPDWAGGGNMIDVARLQVAIRLPQLLIGRLVLQSLEIDEPKVSLIRDDMSRANWNLGKPEENQSKQKPTSLPPIRHFALRGGNLKVNDAIRKLTFDGMVIATEGAKRSAGKPFRLQGQGTLNKEPFKLTFDGDALLDVQLDRPYRFQTKIEAGQSNAAINGSIDKPFDMGNLSADVAFQGQNLANLYYLTNLALPLTPPYKLSAKLRRAGNHFTLDDLNGQIGSSDIHGSGGVDLNDEGRPKLTASLNSRSLNLGDLGVALGAGVQQQSDTTGAPQVPAPQQEPTSPLLLPTFQFQFDRLKSMDAVVDFRAGSVQTQKVPFKAVAFKLNLDHGKLTIDPVDFELPLGRLAGQINLDATARMPQATVDIRISDVKLDQFKGKTATQPPLDGTLVARVRLAGTGNSVHAIAADSNGEMSAVIPQGDIREAFAELTGINVVKGLGLLLTKKDQTVPIRCGVMVFNVKDGDARANPIVIDTEKVLITGDGHIALGDEMLDLNIEGKPKSFRIGRLRTPINVRGTLRHPSIGVSVPAVIKQGGVAVALGAVATPFAALIAFIDPGLAKNADCAALLNQAQTTMQRAPPTPHAPTTDAQSPVK